MSEQQTPYITNTSNGQQAQVTLTKHARRFRAYSKFVNHIAGACAALYELITGEDAPKFTDALRG